MSNALRADIPPGTVVIIKKDGLYKAFHPREKRRVMVTGGFGLRASARGSVISCTWLIDGESDRRDGFDIEAIDDDQAVPKQYAEQQAKLLANAP
jgi:hypothetical protein